MKAYELFSGGGLDSLKVVDRPSRRLGSTEVRIRMRAAALNARDISFAQFGFPTAPAHAIVPLADGCGEVVEAGAEVTRFRVGDRVITSYYPLWQEGAFTPAKTAVSLGAQTDGTLAEELVTEQNAVTHAPRTLTDLEAAALPCAGVAAWHALFEVSPPPPGARVLLLGTGGVSVWALQLAKAAGLFPIVTSSQEDKLARARALGAQATINYRTTPEWQAEVDRLTQGEGASLVLEVGGGNTLQRSLQACAPGGTVVIIGMASGAGGVAIDPGLLIGGSKSMTGMVVGSRSMLDDLVRFVDTNGIKPVVDRVFAFDDARAAYDYLASGSHFGKVVVNIAAKG